MQVFRGAPFARQGPCALTIGNFDGVHLGHRAMIGRLIAIAADRGLPAAVLTFEPHPRELFTPESAPARLTRLREKLELLRDVGVDRVYLTRFNRAFAAHSAQAFMADIVSGQIGAKAVLVGDDFCFGKGRSGTVALLREAGTALGFSTDIMPEVNVNGARCSSTAVRNALTSGDMALATTLLGRPFGLSGRVVRGQQLGRTLGFPTANLSLRKRRVPLSGIFAVEVHGLGRPLPGAASLGTRPTVDDAGVVSLEVHLLDFNGDIYGRHLHIDFLHKLRDEVRYEGLEALTAQIQRDVEAVREYFRDRLGDCWAEPGISSSISPVFMHRLTS